jgi:hypothetical protein
VKYQGSETVKDRSKEVALFGGSGRNGIFLLLFSIFG